MGFFNFVVGTLKCLIFFLILSQNYFIVFFLQSVVIDTDIYNIIHLLFNNINFYSIDILFLYFFYVV